MNQLYFMKGLTLIEEGYCNDALNLVSTIEAEDVKFIYLKALAYIRAANKDLAFAGKYNSPKNSFCTICQQKSYI